MRRCASLQKHFSAACGGGVLWPFGVAALRRHWRRRLSAIGVDEDLVPPAELRRGGATDYFLRHRVVPSLRRQGCWSNERTLLAHVSIRVLI